jgi:serine/threonine protein kinase
MPFSSSADYDPLPFKYVPIEEVERLDKYQPGGYHPILIEDVLQSRYRVAHKLGYGTYSTTWLCRDYQSNTYVAVKVGTAESDARETDVLDYLNHSSPFDHPGKGMIPSVKDRFILHGPNGIHPCYVTNLAMCSVSDAKNGSYRRIFQARTARSLIVQLVLAVECLHSQGVVHGGQSTLFMSLQPYAKTIPTSDLHTGNVLLRLPANFDQLSIDQLYEKYGSPVSEPIVRFDGQPFSLAFHLAPSLRSGLGRLRRNSPPRNLESFSVISERHIDP